MNKKLIFIISSFLLFLASCEDTSIDSSSVITPSDDISSEEIIHIGGDETDEPGYEYRDNASTYNTSSFSFLNKESI